MSFFLDGLIIGFSIAMAVGPISLLCIRNSITKGFLQGFATGLGAALADGTYGAVAGFGITAITSVLLGSKAVLQLVGGLFLCYLGIDMFCKKESPERKEMAHNKLLPIFTTTFFLTMTNPMTIVSFIAIYAGLGIGRGESTMISAVVLTGGIFLGSAVWYAILSGITSTFKNKLSPIGSLWLNRISGCIILSFGVFSLATAHMEQ